MLDVRSETRVGLLQQACGLLQDENVRLATKVRAQALRIAQLEGRVLTQAELDLLDQTPVSPETEADAKPGPADAQSKPKPDKKPQTGHGPRPQPQLPRQEKLYELPEEEQTCGVCQGELEEMGLTEDSEEITVVERTYSLVLHRRKKYRCRCNANVVTADGPTKLIPGGRYSAEFAVSVAIDKYADQLSLQRQVTRMARSGLTVTSATLFDQLHALSRLLEPTYQALFARLLEGPVLHVDETGWLLAPNGVKLGRKRHRKRRYTATVWGLCSDQFAYYALLDSKSLESGRSLLGAYSGVLVADGYQVYETLSQGNEEEQEPPYTLVNCWAHCLRKFRDLKDARCQPVLGWIKKLYAIERKVEGPFPGGPEAWAERRELRQKESRKILEKIRAWALDQGGLRQSGFGKAIHYMMKRWDRLTRFVEDGRIPLDNNPAERALRGPVIGRKIHFCSRSERGAKTTAVLYSMVETARLSGVDPAEYLLAATRAALLKPDAVTLP